jgi:hypothetical protein
VKTERKRSREEETWKEAGVGERGIELRERKQG